MEILSNMKKLKTPNTRISYLTDEMELTPEQVASISKSSVSLVQKILANNLEASPKFIKKFTDAFQVIPATWIENGGPEVKYSKPELKDPWKTEAYKQQEITIDQLRKDNARLLDIIANLSKKK